MQCPKCKKEIDGMALKCENCGTRVASVCKNCGNINPILSKVCSRCHAPLIKICKECGSANLPEAKTCRKCGVEFIRESDIINTSAKINSNPSSVTLSQQKVKSLLLEEIKNVETSIISINGDSGSGKSLILRYVVNDLKEANVIWLTGACTQITQLSPFGYFQNVLLSFFNINNFCPDTLQLKKNSIRFFRKDFPTLSNSEILDLLNVLYPENIDKFENIYQNKTKMFIMMKKVILTIIEKVKAIFVIDNFEQIDGMSYDFLKELLKDEYVLQRCKFIILSKEQKPGLGRISSSILQPENYKDFNLALFTESQIEALITQFSDIEISRDFVKLVSKTSGGNPAFAEQMVMLYKDVVRNNFRHIEYTSLESIMEARLSILRQEDLMAYKMLTAMSVLGTKFYPAMLENFENITEADFIRILDNLKSKGFITQINSLAFEFKTNDIWKAIVAVVKNDDIFEEIINVLYELISMYKQSSTALLGYIVQKLNNNDQSFELWTMLMKHAAYIGDIGLYIIAQKQSLKLIEYKNSPYYQKIKKNIYTRVGKLLEPIDHESAFDYLQKAIMLLDENEEFAHIDLLGYLASSAMKKGNYWGVIECIDAVIDKLSDGMEFELALVKSRKVRPLVRLGNYGQVVNLVDNEVMPVLQKYLAKGKDTSVIKADDLYKLWLETYFDLAEALTLQGDNRAFEIIKLIFEIIEKNKITDVIVLCKAHLSLALANTIKGDLQTSQKILDDMLHEYAFESMDAFIVSNWNFIDILNKFIKKDYDCVTNELFNVVAYANNIHDNFTKNILKTLLAKILREKNDVKRALEILNEQVTHFAKEKIATGVLLSWYLIAEIRLITKGSQFALDIASKALDIAQSPNINNYYYISLFNRLIGEIYIAKQDFESAKVYIEKSIFVARQFELQDILVKSYLLYAKYYQELALPKSSLRATYIRQALQMYQQAKDVQIVSSNPHLLKFIKKELAVLTSFCKLNGITLKKNSK